MSILMHSFNNVDIPQLEQDTIIGDVLIPKGYVNATSILRNFNFPIQQFKSSPCIVFVNDEVYTSRVDLMRYLYLWDETFKKIIAAFGVRALKVPTHEIELFFESLECNSDFRESVFVLAEQSIDGNIVTSSAEHQWLRCLWLTKYGLPIRGDNNSLASYVKDSFWHKFKEVAEKPKMFQSGYVYFLLDPYRNRIKIGQTERTPEDRLQEALTYNPDVKLICSFKTNTPYETEQTLHKQYSHLRIGKSEWFKLDDKLKLYLKSIENTLLQ